MFRCLFLLFFCIPSVHAQLTVTTVVGGAVRSGVSAKNVQLSGTAGITYDPAGNLVFCEHHVVRRINPDGTIQTIAGIGTSGFSGDGGLATQATLTFPASPQYDSKGNLYLVDGGTRIRRIDPSGVITTAIGTGIGGELGADGPPSMAQTAGSSLAIGPDDSLYFSGQADIRRLTPDGSIQVINTGTNPSCSGLNPQPCAPYALTFDSHGNLYFVESFQDVIAPHYLSYIRRISSDGTVAQFAGFGTSGDGAPALHTAFYGISAIAFDAAGNLYVAQTMDTSHTPGFVMAGNTQNDSVIRRIAASDGTVTTVAGAATAPTPLEGPALQAYLSYVSGFAANSDGSLVLSCTNTIGLLTTQSTIQLLAGRTFQPPPDGVKAAGEAWLSLPASAVMAGSRSGNFYFADRCMIRKVDTAGILSTVAGTGNCATSVPKSYGNTIDLPGVNAIALDSHDNIYAAMEGAIYSLGSGSTLSAINGISFPAALAVDSQDRVYVVTFGSELYRIAPDHSVTTLKWDPLPIGFQWLISPAISIDNSDHVYLRNRYPLDGGLIVYRFTPDGSGSPVANLGPFPNPGFAVDAFGDVWYIAFSTLEHVRPSSAPVAMNEPCCGYSGDGGAVVGARFQLYPGGTLMNDSSGNIYVLDAANAAIRKISGTVPPKAPAISSVGIVNAASLLGGTIAPGELISIFGSNFLGSGLDVNPPQNNSIPATIANLRVLFSGSDQSAAFGAITAATANQINVFVPYEIAGSTSLNITVYADYLGSAAVSVPVAQSAFGLSTANASGSGQGAILNQDGSYNSDSNPAAAGSIVSLFGTGEGLTTPALPDGALVISTPYSKPNASVTVTIGGQPANVTYAGAAPFLPTGVLQINAQIPDGVTGDAPVLVSVGGISTSRNVTVAVK
ncbi:MAG TPA: hypothetical protein VMH80_04960 [Bryobacteraceae bacterium]|nr:hypothetical protein [Bryobacteraceae bacterium]